jgi:hypothetical protein
MGRAIEEKREELHPRKEEGKATSPANNEMMLKKMSSVVELLKCTMYVSCGLCDDGSEEMSFVCVCVCMCVSCRFSVW